MVKVTQENRFLTIDTPLGKDVLLMQALTGHEAISALFSFQLDLLSEKPFVPPDAIIGQPVSMTVELRDGTQRFFHGIVKTFGYRTRDARFSYYHAEVVPWLWLLTNTANCRIFQDMTAPEIIKKVFQDLGFRDYKDVLIGNYTRLDYCAQYRETDFNFISRLMEEEGIFYFFEHEAAKHTLMLADSPQAHKPCPGQPGARYLPEGGLGEEEDVVTTWQAKQSLRPAKYTLRDYHFETPGRSLEVSEATTVSIGGTGKLEVYYYPGEYAQRFNKTGQRLEQVEQEGRKFVRLRMEEEEVPHAIASGSSYCKAFVSGCRFDLTHHSEEMNGSYVLTSVRHWAVQSPDYVSGDEAEEHYRNSFTCIPHSVSYRPRRVTLKPVVRGPQTAVVVGRRGEEIDCDKYGRVKVQFHWDRTGRRDENSSCWVRVGTIWAGKQWGVIHIPRIGQEVIVAFLEGDPDQPIIIGSVYNQEQMPPYELPANKTQSGIKSRSSKGGTAAHFNEIRFEDKKGQEEVYVHAERNLTTVVEADESRSVGHDRKTTVEHDDELTVRNNRKATITLNDEESVGNKQTITIGATRSASIGASDSLTAGATISITAGGSVTITAPVITLNAGAVTISGVLTVGGSIVSPVYSPGVGNLV